MTGSAAIDSYRRTAVATADPGRLILIAYEGAIGALAEAEKALAAKDFEAKSRFVAQAQDVVSELMAGLNLEAGEVARNLDSLYAYMLRTLVLVDPATERERISRVRGMLAELYSAWQAIIEGPPLREVPRREAPRGVAP